MAATILVVDDEAGNCDLIRVELEADGHEVTTADGSAAAAEAIARTEFDVVITDLRMPGLSGVDVLRLARQRSADTQVVVMTGFADLATAIECIGGGAFEFLQKPFDMNVMRETVRRALEHREQLGAAELHRLGQAVIATRDPGRLPEAIVDAAVRAVGADDVSLMVPGADGRLVVLFARGLPLEHHLATVGLDERVAGRVAATGEPALLGRGLADDPRFADLQSHGRVRSSIVYPVLVGQRVLGVLNMNRVEDERPFTRRDLARAGLLAAAVALALENARLLQAAASTERLVAAGQLAASIVHEINNPVACVQASLDGLGLALEAPGFEHAARAAGGEALLERSRLDLADARAGVARVREIVADMKAMAHGDDARRERLDLADVVASALRLSRAELQARAQVQASSSAGCFVLGHAGRLSQVFVNLLLNACQAFGERPAATNRIWVVLTPVGDSVEARVSDNGPGIQPQDLHRVFDPLFTTKAASSGTGLGLSISREIVVGHGGHLRVEGRQGEGATFVVTLPRAAEVEAPPPAPTATPPGPRAPGRALRLLFIDDDAGLLRTYARFFAPLGEVVTVDGGEQALELLAARPDFDVVACDVNLPGIDGPELYRRAIARAPSLANAFLFLTGGVTRRGLGRRLEAIGAPVMEKPFDVKALRRLIVRLAAGRGRPPLA